MWIFWNVSTLKHLIRMTQEDALAPDITISKANTLWTEKDKLLSFMKATLNYLYDINTH